ncbi:ankyrin repeat domain-containing protein [Rickettsia endosymbiont of Seladonia tumulorum]|uniref:ankyrin repeat domain-containing protein n=1 Tax=Rickettsia endosymbiont of Seladonia tumulorum TaxID=3066270 RepID=UPI00313A87FE
MSKAIISEKAEPRELKALFIVGPDNDIDSEISKLYDREDCLIIGDGTNPVKITEIYKTLQILNLQIGANTRIDISAHGTRSNKEHKILLDQEYTKTKDFLISLQQLLPNNPLYIHLWSCYGGTANKDIEALNIGSIVVTHIKSSYLSSTDLEKFIRIRSLTHYMNENSLSPYLQYLYDQLENYQGATFSQIESERHIVKFKTIRTPQDYSITTRISNILQINITEEKLTKEIQNYLEIEGKNFCELFKNYISIRDIGKFHEYISNVDNENTRDFISGTIIGLIDSLFNLDIKLKNETTKALNNILDNLKPELINHSIGITPLFIAIHNKNSEIAQTLLEKGADPHFVEADGESLLYIACVKNLVGIANLLLEKGANPNIALKNNYTPLMAACTNQSLKMVEILLEKGAKIN